MVRIAKDISSSEKVAIKIYDKSKLIVFCSLVFTQFKTKLLYYNCI